ncbi:MAG: FAD-binding protein [Tannerella sp.]|jgi:uncharacterized FAD-dependent dehydrogenase|nr:FAD-binding protein [Tannerella sp.]
MIRELAFRLLPEEAGGEQSLKQAVSRITGDAVQDIRAVRVLKRSIDARQRTVYVQLSVRAFVNELPDKEHVPMITYPDVSGCPPAVIVGAGPAGLFAALRLIERGMRPIVIERGKNVRERKKDIARISREHVIHPESNYCFGEGGAGAYSDGKLYTRSRKRGSVERILTILCQYGADTSILSDAHPHIGTDKLPRIIENMREQILRSGGEVHFETRMETLLLHGDEAVGVRAVGGREFRGTVILATGHSARDVYRELERLQVAMEAKDMAVGVRAEHPQELIDGIRYRRPEGRGAFLPAAEYSFVTQVEGRGVYSFCMCPGGFVVPAASRPEQVAVNGMSSSRRNSKWANAGIVVEIGHTDLVDCTLLSGGSTLTDTSPLALMRFQERLEECCRIWGGSRQTAPAQRMDDFVGRTRSASLPVSSYTPGLLDAPLHELLPKYLVSRLQAAFRRFDHTSRGFLTNEAVIIGVETRTSSPVRILRNDATLQSLTLRGLYPCGEGAGYAGGIVSAAVDGENCADRVADHV